jgi:hypothetical protein
MVTVNGFLLKIWNYFRPLYNTLYEIRISSYDSLLYLRKYILQEQSVVIRRFTLSSTYQNVNSLRTKRSHTTIRFVSNY